MCIRDSIEVHTREEIDELAKGKTHGGMIAFCGERSYQKLSDCIQNDECFLCILEGIEDPFNFGHVLRSLYAAGCNGVIIPPRNWTTAAGVVAKSSAGASAVSYTHLHPTSPCTIRYITFSLAKSSNISSITFS